VRTIIIYAVACNVGFVATMALVHYGPQHTGVTVAIVAALILCIELINSVRRTRARRSWQQKYVAGRARVRPSLPNRGGHHHGL
jgi:hypothetical protein